MTLATIRLWLESNHSSIDLAIFCTHENNADYELYKDLMSTVYFPVPKYHLTIIYVKENSNTDCVVNVKIVKIRNEPGQSLPGLQINQTLLEIVNLNLLQEHPKELVAKYILML